MFKIAVKPTYIHPVVVEFPADGGKTTRATFDAEFRRLSQYEITTLGERLKEGEITDLDVARDVLVGWKGVQDEDGAELPWSETARDQVLDIHPVLPSLVKAFFESLAGARAKN